MPAEEVDCITFNFISGPHTWSAHYPEAAGDSQSPIDIVPDEAVFDSDLSTHPIRISYLTEENFEIQNTGESFKVKITQKSGNM